MNSPPSEYDSIAAVGVLCRGNELLVIKRSEQVIAPGKICFPGGTVETGESIPEAITREFLEEVQLIVSPANELWTSVTSWRCKVHWWKVDCKEPADAKADSIEVADVLWKSPQKLLSDPDLLESNRYFLELVLSGEINL